MNEVDGVVVDDAEEVEPDSEGAIAKRREPRAGGTAGDDRKRSTHRGTYILQVQRLHVHSLYEMRRSTTAQLSPVCMRCAGVPRHNYHQYGSDDGVPDSRTEVL